MVLGGLASIKVHPGELWMQRYRDATRGRLRQFEAKGLVALVHALAELEHVPDRPWLEAYTLAAETASAGFGSVAHGTVAYSLQKLQELAEREGRLDYDGFTFTLTW